MQRQEDNIKNRSWGHLKQKSLAALSSKCTATKGSGNYIVLAAQAVSHVTGGDRRERSVSERDVVRTPVQSPTPTAHGPIPA